MVIKSILSSVAVGSILSLVVVEKGRAMAFDPSPIFENFDSFTITIPENGDETDIYYPTIPANASLDLPLIILLQGALVDKSFYSDYASQVARYGFVVAVPNHFRFIPGFGIGLFPEVSQIEAVTDTIESENNDSSSPLFDIIETETLGLLGHSFGGAVGLSAIANQCLPSFCLDTFERPSALQGGAFFGANLRDQITNEPIAINNEGIGISLLQGELDSRALPSNAQATFDNIASPPGVLITLDGVNHFGITNVNNPSGAIPDANLPTVSPAVSIETIARWSGLFLRATLLEEPEAFNYVFITGESLDPNVSSVQVVSVPEPNFVWWHSIILGLLWGYFVSRRSPN